MIMGSHLGSRKITISMTIPIHDRTVLYRVLGWEFFGTTNIMPGIGTAIRRRVGT
jgi:hypothetical protein